MYRRVIPDLWRISDAIPFMPAISAEDPGHYLKSRPTVASTFVAGLELAKQQFLGLDQSAVFEPITYHPAPTSAPTPEQKRA